MRRIHRFAGSVPVWPVKGPRFPRSPCVASVPHPPGAPLHKPILGRVLSAPQSGRGPGRALEGCSSLLQGPGHQLMGPRHMAGLAGSRPGSGWKRQPGYSPGLGQCSEGPFLKKRRQSCPAGVTGTVVCAEPRDAPALRDLLLVSYFIPWGAHEAGIMRGL